MPGLKAAPKFKAPPRPKAAPAPRAKKAKKPKPPCKYGPRGADGLCPKKPRMEASTFDFGADAPSTSARAPAKKSSASSLAERVIVGSAKEAAQTVIQQTVPKLRLTKKQMASQTRILIAEGKKSTGAAVARVASAAAKVGKTLAAPVAALSGTMVAAALGAGLAAFAATTYLINRIKDKKERKAQAEFQAAQAYRQARLVAEQQKGSPLTAGEQASLSRQFKDAIARIQ